MNLAVALAGFWLDKQLRLRPTTQVWYRLTLGRLQAFLGDPEVEQVTSDDICRFLANLAPTYGYSSLAITSTYTYAKPSESSALHFAM